ncbi:UNVERIFIED_ORG: TetR family transcriptional regulator [Shinella sp. XGS7]|nr:TetR family transcriptional regulator [Shinella sp. XGS7]
MVSKTAIPFLNPHPRPNGSKGLHRATGVVSPAPDAAADEGKPQARPQPRQRQKTPKPEGPLKKKRQQQAQAEAGVEAGTGGRRAAASSASAQRRAAHKADLEQRILDAARQLFATQGVEAVTLREVAAAVGYSHATLYSFFSDKAALLARLVAEAQADLSTLLAEARVLVPQQAAAESAALDRAVHAYLRWAAAHPHHYRLMMLESAAPPAAIYAALQALLAPLPAGERPLRAQTLWAGLHGAALLEIVQVPAGGLDWAGLDARAAALAALLRGLLTP